LPVTDIQKIPQPDLSLSIKYIYIHTHTHTNIRITAIPCSCFFPTTRLQFSVRHLCSCRQGQHTHIQILQTDRQCRHNSRVPCCMVLSAVILLTKMAGNGQNSDTGLHETYGIPSVRINSGKDVWLNSGIK